MVELLIDLPEDQQRRKKLAEPEQEPDEVEFEQLPNQKYEKS
jgi:hypothetical protein